MHAFQKEFIELSESVGALRFGEFQLKSGRTSPYFFNAGRFNSGASLATLGACYADKIASLDIEFDMLFGPAYKGIPLVCATAIALAKNHGVEVPYAFNRKEAKDHGEGGNIVGAELNGKILILDDVITAGTAIRESVAMLGASPSASIEGVVIGLDRQEKGPNGESAVQEIAREAAIPVHAIVQLNDLIDYLSNNSARLSASSHANLLDSLNNYRNEFGIG